MSRHSHKRCPLTFAHAASSQHVCTVSHRLAAKQPAFWPAPLRDYRLKFFNVAMELDPETTPRYPYVLSSVSGVCACPPALPFARSQLRLGTEQAGYHPSAKQQKERKKAGGACFALTWDLLVA